jgi:hypothetical protein
MTDQHVYEGSWYEDCTFLQTLDSFKDATQTISRSQRLT